MMPRRGPAVPMPGLLDPLSPVGTVVPAPLCDPSVPPARLLVEGLFAARPFRKLVLEPLLARASLVVVVCASLSTMPPFRTPIPAVAAVPLCGALLVAGALLVSADA